MGCFQGCRITQIQLFGDLFGRQLKLKEFDDPQPALTADAKPVDPTAGEVMERICAAFAAEAFVYNSIYLVAMILYAETMVVFPT